MESGAVEEAAILQKGHRPVAAWPGRIAWRGAVDVSRHRADSISR